MKRCLQNGIPLNGRCTETERELFYDAYCTYLIHANAVLYAALSYLPRVQSVIWSQLDYDGDREYALLEALEGIIGKYTNMVFPLATDVLTSY